MATVYSPSESFREFLARQKTQHSEKIFENFSSRDAGQGTLLTIHRDA